MCVMSPACAAAVAAGAPHASRTQHRRLFAQRTVGTQLSTKSFTTKTRRRAVVSASAAEDDDAADQDSATAGEAGDMLVGRGGTSHFSCVAYPPANLFPSCQLDVC